MTLSKKQIVTDTENKTIATRGEVARGRLEDCCRHMRTLPASAAATAELLSRARLCATHRRQPARLPRPWDSPGKNTGVGAISFSNA